MYDKGLKKSLILYVSLDFYKLTIVGIKNIAELKAALHAFFIKDVLTGR
jgi:hypothetical protein